MVDPSGDATLPAPELAASPAALPVVDRAHYDVLSEHARGGLGRILRARDRRTGRLVAIKEMLHGTPDAAARFFREAMITANLQHPAIVPVYELGQWTDGEPFYAMKLVAGRALDHALRDAHTLDDRLAMLPRLLDVADALAYAHGEGVIHRDLKPANVLVGAYGETVVIDWGLAKRKTDVEAEGAVMGTPAYMPPEQARGDAVDARADVYALGAMLYHLLGGHVPYAESKSADDILDAVRAGPPRPLGELEPGVPADLIAIVTKAMAHARDARYASARELADDLRRFQTGQLVGAHAYSTSQLVRRFVRRHRAELGVAAVLLAALAVTAVVAFRKVTAERNVAQAERVEADRQRDLAEQRNRRLILTQARGALESDPTLALAWLQQLPAGAPEWAEARMIASDAQLDGVARWVLDGHTGSVNDLAFTPDENTLISAGDDATLRLWDLETGRARVLTDDEPITEIAISANGRWLISIGPWYADSPTGRRIVVWDLTTSTPRLLPPVDGERDTNLIVSWDSETAVVIDCHGGVRAVELATLRARSLRAPMTGSTRLCASALDLSRDGAILAAETTASTVHLLQLADGTLVETLDTQSHGSVRNFEFLPDGKALLVLTSQELAVWTRGSGSARTIVANQGDLRGFEISDDGSLLAVAGTDYTIRAQTLGVDDDHVVARHTGPITTLGFSADQRHVISAGDDGTVIVSSVARGPSLTLRGHRGTITAVERSDDGRWIASSSDDGTLRVWPAEGPHRSWTPPKQQVNDQLLVAPDGGSVVVASHDGAVARWSLDGVPSPLRAPSPIDDVTSNDRGAPLAQSRDGRVLAAGRPTRGIDVWTGPDPAARAFDDAPLVAGLSMSADGALLAAVAIDGAVTLYHLDTGVARPLASPQLVGRRRRAIAISADGGVVVWSDPAHGLGVYDVARDGTRTITGPGGEFISVLITADGASAISASNTGDVVLWNLAASTATTLLHHVTTADDLGGITLSPDGAWLACASADHEIRMIEVATGRTMVWTGHVGAIFDLAFSADGHTLASASDDATVRLWEVPSGTSRVLSHQEEVVAVEIVPDGRIVTATLRGTIGVILDDVPRDEAGLRTFLAGATNLVVDPQAR